MKNGIYEFHMKTKNEGEEGKLLEKREKERKLNIF